MGFAKFHILLYVSQDSTLRYCIIEHTLELFTFPSYKYKVVLSLWHFPYREFMYYLPAAAVNCHAPVGVQTFLPVARVGEVVFGRMEYIEYSEKYNMSE